MENVEKYTIIKPEKETEERRIQKKSLEDLE